jgi:hypothetical protein
MTWVAWRQYRTGAAIALAILAAMTAFLIPTGLERLALFRDSGLESCLGAGSDCVELRAPVLRSYDSLREITTWFNFAPAIIGILLAAPIITEFEQRTHRLAWTQSITRERWLVTKLAMALAGVVLFAVALTLVMTWWHAPLDQAEILAGKELGRSFDFEGAMPFSYSVFALSLALAAGSLSRSMLVAMPIALVGFTALRVLTLELLRSGLTSGVNIGPGETLNITTRDMERFWTIQAIEAAIFLSAAAVLLSLTFWVVLRRTS